jgi:hypothetical protein
MGASDATRIRVASSDIWGLLVQYYELLGKQRSLELGGPATTLGQHEAALCASRERLFHSLRPLDLLSAEHLIIPQYNKL